HCLPLFLLATALVRMASCSLFDLPSAVCLACHLLNSSSDLPLIFHFDNNVDRPTCLSSFFFSVLFCFLYSSVSASFVSSIKYNPFKAYLRAYDDAVPVICDESMPFFISASLA